MNDEVVEITEELEELGAVSEETRGGFAGATWDGSGSSRRWP